MSRNPFAFKRVRLSVETLERRDALSTVTASSALAAPVLQASHVAFLSAAAPRPVTYTTDVIARHLQSPTGIAVGRNGTVFFTEVPTPGVGGGMNGVASLNPRTGEITSLNMGEPEPTNIVASADGTLYWTCKSAGVILRRTTDGNVSVLLSGLNQPSGIALDPQGRTLYYTEVPTPGIAGSAGGLNSIHRVNLRTMRNEVIHQGDPEPSDIAVDQRGNVYWTCTSAGVILRQDCSGHISVIASGLNKPVGIAIDRSGKHLYFTEVPTPGVPGSQGGNNTVNVLNLRSMERTVINKGDPEPTDIAVDNAGNVYWTCTSAGVIVRARVTR